MNDSLEFYFLSFYFSFSVGVSINCVVFLMVNALKRRKEKKHIREAGMRVKEPADEEERGEKL